MSNANYSACQLTKRELIAAMAMQGFISNMSLVKGASDLAETRGMQVTDVMASGCVDYADALLAQLERTA